MGLVMPKIRKNRADRRYDRTSKHSAY